MRGRDWHTIEMIPLDRINVLNSRVRSRKVFREIVSSISHLGLKRPITVTRRENEGGEPRYDLVCGEGRVEAYAALGQTAIPAIVVEASEEDCFLMSLIENLARRQHGPTELLDGIGDLYERGYSHAEIARKTDLSAEYVRGVIQLLEQGEERLLAAAETGRIPINTAIEIARTKDGDLQSVLQEAYESGQLRGSKLIAARRLIEQRRRRGKYLYKVPNRPRGPTLSSESLVRAYEQEAERQRLMIKKAELTQGRLLFVVSALKRLLEDEHFVTLLRAEGLATMPRYLAEQIKASDRS